jgi:hypothetical protein
LAAAADSLAAVAAVLAAAAPGSNPAATRAHGIRVARTVAAEATVAVAAEDVVKGFLLAQRLVSSLRPDPIQRGSGHFFGGQAVIHTPAARLAPIASSVKRQAKPSPNRLCFFVAVEGYDM